MVNRLVCAVKLSQNWCAISRDRCESILNLNGPLSCYVIFRKDSYVDIFLNMAFSESKKNLEY